MVLGGMWRFTLTAREALVSAGRWLTGRVPATPEIAFDDLREAVKKGDRNAARAMVWLGFCVGKDSDSELDAVVEAKAKTFLREFVTGKGCPKELRIEIGTMLEKYHEGYEKSAKAAEGVLNTLLIMRKEMREDLRELFRGEKPKVKN